MKCYDCPYSYQRGNNFPVCIWQPHASGELALYELAPCEEEYIEEKDYIEEDKNDE